jgi:hypothetical protein
MLKQWIKHLLPSMALLRLIKGHELSTALPSNWLLSLLVITLFISFSNLELLFNLIWTFSSIGRPEYSRKFLAHFSKTRTYIRLKAQTIRIKEDQEEKLKLAKLKRAEKQAKNGTNLAVANYQNFSVRDHCQRAYQTN